MLDITTSLRSTKLISEMKTSVDQYQDLLVGSLLALHDKLTLIHGAGTIVVVLLFIMLITVNSLI